MYTGETMKLPTHDLKLDEIIFNFAYDNSAKAANYQKRILEDNVEKDEDAEVVKAKASKKTKEVVHDSLIKNDDAR